jgi:hypothetical protein
VSGEDCVQIGLFFVIPNDAFKSLSESDPARSFASRQTLNPPAPVDVERD